MQFVGKLVRGDKSINVSGSYTIQPSGGLMGWSGTLTTTEATALMPGDAAIELSDGRSANILVTSAPSRSGQQHITAHFQGKGPPP